MVSIGFVYFCSVIKNNYELQNDGTMKNILSKRTFIVLPLFLFSLHPLWGQKSNFKNDICIPGKLYMLSDIRNDVFVEALIKRWRPYNDFVRFSGDCVYSRKLNRVASVDTPVDGSNMKIELVNSDEFEIIKEKAISICVGKKGIGTQEVTVQILGDSFVNGAFFRDALLSKNYIPGIKLVGLRNIKNEEGQYDEGRGGWTVKKYFEIPKGEMTSYHGYMQPVGEYRYWGSCEFWKNCYKVINGELTDTEIVYNCGRYDQCITKFDKETGYLAAPKKNYKMYYIMLLTEVAVSALIMTFIPFKLGILLTVAMLFLINLLFAANYNMIVIEDLLKKGYVPLDYTSSNILIKKGIYFKLQ